ncbi:MAG: hypothetical protein M3514_06980 [Actinomycetota bacterium]|nr:hypothetical protein [Actinomycetota bacterium]
MPADQALTPFGPIAEPNPFGSLGDLRLLPDRDTRVRVDLWDDASALHFFLCDAVNTERRASSNTCRPSAPSPPRASSLTCASCRTSGARASVAWASATGRRPSGSRLQ